MFNGHDLMFPRFIQEVCPGTRLTEVELTEVVVILGFHKGGIVRYLEHGSEGPFFENVYQFKLDRNKNNKNMFWITYK